jgi:hypothetical protein
LASVDGIPALHMWPMIFARVTLLIFHSPVTAWKELSHAPN